ncbi:hypothetical protein DPMN_180041 [Dreissena polymorpha]|uniref:Uncharacterized protein n=1 Tax=Dreissena polymorpha TaxID=45954 RepID=A0A9D4EG68_DREPO|nr:hypothetical protein DPMN_180041 [Dreissena polymorpha]
MGTYNPCQSVFTKPLCTWIVIHKQRKLPHILLYNFNKFTFHHYLNDHSTYNSCQFVFSKPLCTWIVLHKQRKLPQIRLDNFNNITFNYYFSDYSTYNPCKSVFSKPLCTRIVLHMKRKFLHILLSVPDWLRVDGHWGSWSVWSLCTYDCHQTRTRAYDNPAPLHGGKDCHGLTTETRDCYTSPCRVDGHWSSWATWSLCTSHCNQTRTRACANPAPLHGRKDCHGPTTDTRDCYTSPCRVDGHGGSWTTWSLCSSHCNQARTRACDNPSPLHGGKDCHGVTIQTHDCYTASCRLKDCSQLLSSSIALPSGVYTLTTPLTHAKEQVYCDMGTGGGGWTTESWDRTATYKCDYDYNVTCPLTVHMIQIHRDMETVRV